MSDKQVKNKIKTPLGERIFYHADNILMILLCVVVLIPLIHVLASSFSDGVQYMGHSSSPL